MRNRLLHLCFKKPPSLIAVFVFFTFPCVRKSQEFNFPLIFMMIAVVMWNVSVPDVFAFVIFSFESITTTKKKPWKQKKKVECLFYFLKKIPGRLLGTEFLVFSSNKNEKKEMIFSWRKVAAIVGGVGAICCCCCRFCCGSLRDGWAPWREMGEEKAPVLFLSFFLRESNDRSKRHVCFSSYFLSVLSLWCAQLVSWQKETRRDSLPPPFFFAVHTTKWEAKKKNCLKM